MENTTFLHPKKGCHLNFQEENDIVIYMVSFLGSLAVLPGNIISALFMDKIGRIRIIGKISSTSANGLLCVDFAWFVSACHHPFFLLGGSMLVSSACTFLLLLSFSQGAVICWQCLFYGASVAAWNGLQVISVELYPSSKRYSPLIKGPVQSLPSHRSFYPFPVRFVPIKLLNTPVTHKLAAILKTISLVRVKNTLSMNNNKSNLCDCPSMFISS